jgi:heme oxygenase
MLSTNIKEATKTGHQELEKKVVQKLKAIRGNRDYADLLRYFYAYFSQVEKSIAPFITDELLADHSERRNSSYIKNDIEALGATVDDLPLVTVPEIHSSLQALGALYVMEGSIMGGSIIVQMLAKDGITEGVTFFSGYGAATGQMWAAFIAVMNAAANTPEEQMLVIECANATFNNFSAVFNENELAATNNA